MTHITCSVPSCPSSSLMNKELKFHQFPYSEERRKEWILACNGIHVIHEDWNFFKNKYVCSLHFDRYSYSKKGFLSRYAVPTLYLDEPLPANQINLKCAETQTEGEAETESRDNKSQDDKTQTQKENVVLQSSGTVEYDKPDQIFIQVKKIGHEDFVVTSSPNIRVTLKIGEAENHTVSEDGNLSTNYFDRNINNNLTTKKRKIEENSCSEEEDKSITLTQFLKACDVYLPENLREIVKTNAKLYTNQI
ncbi:hypothetical protein HF086_004856 [Spodoptera exigua]|uniref:THAP-type domain-containing protein n=1 Tax=Spodoptera exigua TaxID=7107 RepID=A0A922M5F5_SPOEX|nr:hypothetical protein HF086_004856 [Spodoptera exigua]